MTGSLTVVGTGYLVAGQATPEARAAMAGAERLLFLVGDPATRAWLEGLNPDAESLYDCYAEGKPRSRSYDEMVARILAPVRRGLRVCAAFYGHPGVFVRPSHEAIRQARAEGFEARMLPGISAEDCLFADLGVDPAACGCQSYEASDFLLRRRRFDPASALILWQIGAIGVRGFFRAELWSREGLRVLGETLGESYPARHEVVLYEAAHYPVCEPRIDRIPLAVLPEAQVSLLSTLYVPPRGETPLDAGMLARLGLTPPEPA